MPEIPTYGEQRVRTEIRPAPTLNPRIINADSYGASAVRGVANAVSDVARVELEEQRRADDVAVFGATNKLDIFRTKQDVDFRSKQGENALNDHHKISEDYNKTVDEIENELTTPNQKAAFRRYADNRWVDTDRSAQTHVAAERKRVEKAVFDTRVDLTVQEAVSNRNNPQQIQDSLMRLRGLRVRQAETAGMQNTGLLEAAIKADEGAVWSSVVEADIASGNYEVANERLKTNRESIGEKHAEAFQKDIDHGLSIKAAEALTAKALTTKDGSRPSMSEAMAIANEEKDPTIRKMATDGVRSAFAQADLAKETDDETTYGQFYGILRDNGGNLRELPLAQFNALGPKWQKALQADAAGFRGESMPTKKDYSNIKATNDIRSLIDTGYFSSPNGATIKMNRNQVAALAAESRLTAEQTEDVLEYHKGQGNKGSLSITDLQRVYRGLKGKKNADFTQERPKLFEQVRDALPPDEKVTDALLQPIVAKLMVEGVVPGGLWDPDMTYSEAVEKGLGDDWMPDMPSEHEVPLAEQMKKEGYPVSRLALQRYGKYAVQGYPTPMKNGRPMTVQEAVLEGLVDPTPVSRPQREKDKAPSFERGAGGWRYMYPNYIR